MSSISTHPDGLHLRADRLFCAEVISDDVFGRGEYEFTVASDLARLDTALVLGLFTYSDSPEYDHHEINIEASRRGETENDDLQFVVQPPRPSSIVRSQIPAGVGPQNSQANCITILHPPDRPDVTCYAPVDFGSVTPA